MNKTQRKILFITAIIISLIIIFPPYQVKLSNGIIKMSGYAPIFDLPSYHNYTGYSTVNISADINAVMLFAEIFGSLVICGLAYVATKD